MNVPTKCPFGHENVSVAQTISTRDLATAYHSIYGVDVRKMFGGNDEIYFCRCVQCAISFFYPPTPGPGELYEELSRIPWYYSNEKEEYRLAARRIVGGQKVLEVGCGFGNFARYLKDPSYVGLELNTDAVKTGKERGLDVRSERIEAFSIDHANEFDVVCSFQVLEHVHDPAEFIAASVTCARPGGLIMFGIPNADGALGLQPDDILNMPPHHITWWTGEVFWRMAESLRVEVVAIETERLTHVNLYAYIRVMRILMNGLGIKDQFLFNGSRYKAIRTIARATKKFAMVGLYDHRMLPAGQSMLAILRKDRL